MRIRTLRLTNFRKLGWVEIELGAKNVIFGSNGAGKTTILEAVYLLSWGKSFRAVKDSEAIKWGERVSSLEGSFENEEYYNIRITLLSSGKKIYLNGKMTSRSNLIGKVPVLFISPDAVSMLTGAPALRRNFLDRILSQLESEYLLKYRIYHKLIKEKNAILSRGGHLDQALDLINHRILKVSLYIWQKRKELIDFLSDEEIRILYKPSGLNIDLDKDKLEKTLLSFKGKEAMRGFSLFGPHLDEFDILKREGVSFRKFGSRGESKWAIWKLFTKALSLFKDRKPILLVDEIFSELDSHNRSEIERSLKLLDVQVLVTALYPYEGLKDFCLFEVRDGEVRRYNIPYT